jgi:hypothetical protein
MTDEIMSEDELAAAEEAMSGPRLWCGVFAGQLAKVELTIKTHPDLTPAVRDQLALRMREVVRELAVQAGASEPEHPLVGLDGVPGEQDSMYVPDGEPVPAGEETEA